MSIGSFDKRVEIQTRSGVADGLGNVAASWATTDTRWCSLEDQSGRELYRAQRVDPVVSAVVTLREQYVDLSPADRLVIGSRTFSIKSVLGSSDRTPARGQIIACSEDV